MADRFVLTLEEVHFVVLEVELLLQRPDGRRSRVHLLPHPLLDEHFGLDYPGEVGGLLFLVDEVADDLGLELMDHLLLGDPLQPGQHQLGDLPLPYLLEVMDVVVAQKVVVSSIKPLAFAHLLEGPGELIRIVLNHGLDVPDLRSISLWPVSQEYIQLYLPVFISEHIVPVPLDRC